MTKTLVLLTAAGLSLTACGNPKAADNDASLASGIANSAPDSDVAGNSYRPGGDANNLSGNVAVPAGEGNAAGPGNAGAAANAQ